jgi:hypothetical protein
MSAESLSLDPVPAAPGDLFVLRATAELPVEWAILEQRDGRLLAVPADTNPAVGSGDLAVGAAAPAGPLTLRCRFGVWLAAEACEPGLRTGSLTPETLAEARRCHRRLAAGARLSSPLAEEVDVDIEYRDWLRDVLEPARTLASAASAGAGEKTDRSARRTWGPAHRLAALFALAALGLGVWTIQQQREIGRLQREAEQLAAPIFGVSTAEVVLGRENRGSEVVEIPPGASHVLLVLVLDPSIEAREGRFEISGAAGRIVWSRPSVDLAAGEFKLILRRELLPDGEYRVRIADLSGKTLSEKAVEIRTSRELAR